MRGVRCGAAACLVVAMAATAQQAAAPIEGLRLPIEHWPDGKVKTQILAGKALMPASGPIDGRDVRVELYREDGTVDTVMTAETCRFDRESQTVTSDGPVLVDRPGLKIEGRGFEWNGRESRVKISSEVKVTFRRDVMKGLKLAEARGAEPRQ